MDVDSNVEVLYNFEYSTKDGQLVTIKEGEKLLLLKKTNEDWWQVIRCTGRPFYVPSSYVKILDEKESQTPIPPGNTLPKPPSKNFTVSVNVKSPATWPSKSKVMINCNDFNETIQTERYGRIPAVPVAKKKSDVAEANILDDNMSSSLVELAKEIEFKPKPIPRIKYSGSFKTQYERKVPLRQSPGSMPDLTHNAMHLLGITHSRSVEDFSKLRNVPTFPPSVSTHRPLGNNIRSLQEKLCRIQNFTKSVEGNNLKDSSDSFGSGGGRTSAETLGTSSTESIDKVRAPPVAKPRKIRPNLQDDVIYANCHDIAQELMKRRPNNIDTDSEINDGDNFESNRMPGLSPVLPSSPPKVHSNWSFQANSEPFRPSYIHHRTGEKISEELSATLRQISHIETDRRLRTAKTHSLIMPNRKELSDFHFTGKGWPKAPKPDGQLTLKCEGPLWYTKVAEGNRRVRKNWCSAYVVLTEFFLLVYKDMKAFHTPKTPPELTIDLSGAEVESGEKVSGRKHVLVVISQCGLQIALQCDNIHSVLFWATTIQHTVAAIPKLERPAVNSTKLGTTSETIHEEVQKETSKKGSNIGRSKSVNFKNKDDNLEDTGNSSPTERQVKIKARLRKFFLRRPTMDSLVKKGIWKDESVFGTLLEQACDSGGGCKDKEIGKVPLFVVRCVHLIESSDENMKTDGLYRASGNLSQIQKIRLQIDQNNYTGLEKEEDVHVLTGALKLFFRELKEPLIPYKLFTKAMAASTKSNTKERINLLCDIVKSLPTANRDTLKFLLTHLLRVTKYQEFNRMHVANVAIVFGPTLMWPEQESLNMAVDLMQQNMVIEALLLNFHLVFK